MRVLGIDPGNEHSALVIYDGALKWPVTFAKHNNGHVLTVLNNCAADVLVIEQVACYGMAVGETVFETVFWSGRFRQAWTGPRFDRLKRMAIKMHLCHSSRAKDGNVRQALIDRFGPPGTKNHPGALYGISGDVWAALAVAVTWSDLNLPRA